MLHGVSDLIGFIATIGLLGVPIYLVYSGIRGQFTSIMFWLFLVPVVVAIFGNMLHGYSWHLADKRQFEYDYEKDSSTWVDESGIRQSFKYGSSRNKTV